MSEGYEILIAPCVNCGGLFTSNPDLVPSIRVIRREGRWVPDPNGLREPVCRDCVEADNVRRRKAGLPVTVILEGAYP